VKKTEVMFFFDTEDFTCDKSQDAAMKLAEICSEESVRGHFAVVGLVAERLRRTGRTDVIEALKKHEIGSHTWGHTVHPDICEMTDCADFEEAYKNVSEKEGEAVRIIKEVFDLQEILFAVPPGNSKSYAAMYCYSDEGLPFYCDTVVCDAEGKDTFCANAMHIAYDEAVEEIAFGGSVQEMLDRCAGRNRIIIYTHPNMAYFSEFWDGPNFAKYNRHGEGDYVMCTPRTEAESETYFDTFRKIIRAVREDERFRITSLREILSAQKPRPAVSAEDIQEIYEALQADYAPIREKQLCLYDLFIAAAAFLRGEKEYLPGKAYGLLEKPEEIEEAVRLSVKGVREAAKSIPETGFLPCRFEVDGHKLGVGDMLYAMYASLTAEGEEFVLEPHPEMRMLDRYPQLRDMALRGTWLHGDDFMDDYLSDRLRLQAYTIR